MQTVTLGPFMLSLAVVALFLGIIAASTTSGFLEKRGHAGVDTAVWCLALTVLLAARLGFVVSNWSSYSAHPLDIFDIRDGGFSLWVGLVVLLLGVALLAWRRRAWRIPLPLAVVTGLAVWGLVLGAGIRLQQAANPPMPDIVLDSLDHGAVPLRSFRGKPMVLNLWATWCGPCRREMPVLVAAQAARPDLHFIFADQGESAGDVRQYLVAGKLDPGNVLLDTTGKLAMHYHVRGYPVTLFLTADGHLVDRHVGALTQAMLDSKLARLSATTDGVSP